MTRLIRIAFAAVIVAVTFHIMADSRKVLKIAITAKDRLQLMGVPRPSKR